MEAMKKKIKDGEIKDVMKEAVEQFKEIITKVVISEADVTVVLHSVKDPMCVAL